MRLSSCLILAIATQVGLGANPLLLERGGGGGFASPDPIRLDKPGPVDVPWRGARPQPQALQEPAAPVEPAAPWGPVSPVRPVSPIQHEAPSEPESPLKRVESDTPAGPEAPVEPESPVEPEAPFKPASPVRPDTPISPDRPVKPADPGRWTDENLFRWLDDIPDEAIPETDAFEVLDGGAIGAAGGAEGAADTGIGTGIGAGIAAEGVGAGATVGEAGAAAGAVGAEAGVGIGVEAGFAAAEAGVVATEVAGELAAAGGAAAVGASAGLALGPLAIGVAAVIAPIVILDLKNGGFISQIVGKVDDWFRKHFLGEGPISDKEKCEINNESHWWKFWDFRYGKHCPNPAKPDKKMKAQMHDMLQICEPMHSDASKKLENMVNYHECDPQNLTSYHFSPALNKPFLGQGNMTVPHFNKACGDKGIQRATHPSGMFVVPLRMPVHGAQVQCYGIFPDPAGGFQRALAAKPPKHASKAEKKQYKDEKKKVDRHNKQLKQRHKDESLPAFKQMREKVGQEGALLSDKDNPTLAKMMQVSWREYDKSQGLDWAKLR